MTPLKHPSPDRNLAIQGSSTLAQRSRDQIEIHMHTTSLLEDSHTSHTQGCPLVRSTECNGSPSQMHIQKAEPQAPVRAADLCMVAC